MSRSERKTGHALRTGFTTGACAAAAARGAAAGFLAGTLPAGVETRLPNGQAVFFSLAGGEVTPDGARAVVVKDAGDDPDCTHGAHLTARVRPLPGLAGEVRLLGGEGVGRVTRPGVGLPPGEPAINPVPRLNIDENVRAAAGAWLMEHGLEVTISVPGGEIMARRTLNPRLGIVEGISILGTSGIVHPYSTAAFKAAVRQSIAAGAGLGLERLVLTTGRRTERFAMARYPALPDYAFVQMGDFVGAALEAFAATAIPEVALAVMPGKLAKIAQGLANTHARKGRVDLQAVADVARSAGGDEERVRRVAAGVTVRHAVELLPDAVERRAFGLELARKALPAIRRRLPPERSILLMVFDFEGELLALLEEPA